MFVSTTDRVQARARPRGINGVPAWTAWPSSARTQAWDRGTSPTRQSPLTHFGEPGASLLMLMAKSRHKKPENVRRYFKPSPEAIAELTSLLAPRDTRR